MSDLVPPSYMPATAAGAAAPPALVGPDTFITIKIQQNGSINRRVKVPLRELGARVFPQKIRQFLAIPPTDTLVLERYSDSLANYVVLDSENPAVYKQLYRAAKAKLKLRIKVTTTPQILTVPSVTVEPEKAESQESAPKPYRYLETVLSPPAPAAVADDDVAKETDSQTPQVMTSRPFQHSVMSTMPEEKQRAYPLRLSTNDHPSSMFCIDCNHCGLSIPGEHYHCSICDHGDYDLCPACVDAGVSCAGQDHWLLKRAVVNGVIVNSTTETVAPKRLPVTVQELTDYVAPSEKVEEKPIAEKETVTNTTQNVEEKQEPLVNERTCNACFREFAETSMVTCNDCDDYDLCVTCLLKDSHGHHPAHEFSVLHDDQFCLRNLVLSRCRPGRHYHHAAVCDGCEKRIVGVRHKCMSCPDWDYCWSCMETAGISHPHHRFVPIYGSISEPAYDQEVHYGIYCDGPLCRSKPSATYISGVRYKCAICHDTDFCAACEALPTASHNRTHPLIKFRTPVRSACVSTIGDNGFGGQPAVLGDRTAPAVPSFVKSPSTNSSSSTVVEAPSVVEKVEVKETVKESVMPVPPVVETATPSANLPYSAYFIRDSISDGTNMAPSHVFTQTWTLYNPGPSTWPVGTSVRYVGGDAMFNVNTEHPSSTVALAEAMSSNELTNPVGPSESADFSVTLKSTQRTGTSISYWRLKLPNGTPFGHKLWCDIKVVDEPAKPEVKKPEVEKPEVESETPLAGSNMVFPKLEKESPVSSTHEALTETHSPSFTAPVSSTDGVLEDVESLTLEDVESDDAGWFTDEEYDILDASDQESFGGKHI